MCLVVRTSDPLVDNVEHRLLLDSGGDDESKQAKHGHASVQDLGLLGDTKVHLGHVAKGFSLTGGESLVLGRVGVDKERVHESEGRNGGSERDHEEVDIGNQDEGTFVGDGGLALDDGEVTPLLQVEGHIGVGDKSVSLAVGSGTDHDPAEHGVTAVPLFRLDGRSPSPLVELRPFFLPRTDGRVNRRLVELLHSTFE